MNKNESINNTHVINSEPVHQQDHHWALCPAGVPTTVTQQNDMIVLLTKTLSYKLQSHVNCTLIYYIYYHHTAVLGCAVGLMTQKCCDCVVHGSKVWTWLHRCNAHNKSLLEAFFCFCCAYFVQLRCILSTTYIYIVHRTKEFFMYHSQCTLLLSLSKTVWASVTICHCQNSYAQDLSHLGMYMYTLSTVHRNPYLPRMVDSSTFWVMIMTYSSALGGCSPPQCLWKGWCILRQILLILKMDPYY